jgi:glycosyltransferase involved in cell wall biosynthesis
MIQPANAVNALGLTDVEAILVIEDEDPNAFIYSLRGRHGNVQVTSVDDPECDVVVFQRPMHRHISELIPLLQKAGTAVVVEMDDDLDSVDPKNPAHKACDPRYNQDSNAMWAAKSCQLADLVILSTQALVKRYAAHGRYVVLPNYVPEAYLKIEREPNATPVVGWTGNPRTHPGDLEVMGYGVTRQLAKHDWNFRAIGSSKTYRSIHVVNARSEVIEWAPIDEYPQLVANLDVGLAPLSDTRFNKAKSWLKPLEYAALGVPFVVSPLPEYRALAKLGAGDLVSTTTTVSSAWERALEPLLSDPDYRLQRAEEGRRAAAELTIEGHAMRWIQAWSDARTVLQAG